MASIFTKIINGEIPSYKLAEDEKHFAFLDINPLSRGHALVVPKREVDYIFDLDEAEVGELFQFARKVARAIESVVECERIGVAVIGLEVPHAHVHLSPINSIGDLDFAKPKVQLPRDEFEELAAKISAVLS